VLLRVIGASGKLLNSWNYVLGNHHRTYSTAMLSRAGTRESTKGLESSIGQLPSTVFDGDAV
jgi:hypothetical protein